MIRKQDIQLYLMALPVVLYLLVFCYAPMFGLVMAFQKIDIGKGIFGSAFCGLDNFQFLFSTTDAWVITRNTVCYNLVFIVVNNVLAVVLALLMSELHSQRYAKTLQTVYMLPYFLSWAIIAIIVDAFLDRSNGLVNHVIHWLGGSGRTNWYLKREIWPGLLVFVKAWSTVGYTTILYLAVISGIPGDYYEAAIIDGANKFQQALYITIPQLRFVLVISVIMAMGNIFRGDFGLFYTVTQDSGKLYPVTDVIDTYIYRGLTQLSNVGMSTAAGLYQSVVGFGMILFVNAITRRIDPESAMF